MHDRDRLILNRAALGVLVLILALFVADAAGGPEELGAVASLAFSALVIGAGIYLWVRAHGRNERVVGRVLTAVGGISLVAWVVDLAV